MRILRLSSEVQEYLDLHGGKKWLNNDERNSWLGGVLQGVNQSPSAERKSQCDFNGLSAVLRDQSNSIENSRRVRRRFGAGAKIFSMEHIHRVLIL